MITKHLVYEDFNGQMKEEDAYFNLSRTEASILSAKKIDGLSYAEHLQKLVDDEDLEGMLRTFKEIAVMAYGIKSEDGRRFVKDGSNGEEYGAGKEFAQTQAFDTLFTEILDEENGLVNFITGILPQINKGTSADPKAVKGEPHK